MLLTAVVLTARAVADGEAPRFDPATYPLPLGPELPALTESEVDEALELIGADDEIRRIIGDRSFEPVSATPATVGGEKIGVHVVVALSEELSSTGPWRYLDAQSQVQTLYSPLLSLQRLAITVDLRTQAIIELIPARAGEAD